jgi:probable addiction module antidote protein
MKPSKPYRDVLINDLKDVKTALEFLNTAIEEGDRDTFLLSLRYVAEAQGGIGRLAKAAKMNRVNLYRILTKKGNPELHTLDQILHGLGLRLAIVEKQPKKLRRAA